MHMIPLIPLSRVLIGEGWHRHSVTLQRCWEQVILPFARTQASTNEAKKRRVANCLQVEAMRILWGYYSLLDLKQKAAVHAVNAV